MIHSLDLRNTMTAGPACWICLDEGPDKAGQPLRRDCSCRGDHAGFAHLSCIITFAKSRCKEMTEYEPFAFDEPWMFCHHCKQKYQNELALDLSAACLLFAENTYGYEGNSFTDKLWMLEAIHLRLDSMISNFELSSTNDHLTLLENGVGQVKMIHSMVEQIINNSEMTSWVHMPKKSYEFETYRLLRGHFEARGYAQMARLLICTSVKRGPSNKEMALSRALWCYRKARATYKLIDVQELAHETESKAAFVKSFLGYGEDAPAIIMERMRSAYGEAVRQEGKDSETSMKIGLALGVTLARFKHAIEAERLVKNLAVSCRRVHGREHKLTKYANAQLEKLKRRMILVSTALASEPLVFEALYYEEDGKHIVLKGPVACPRKVDEERTIATMSSNIIPQVGCPVVCCGLKDATHLNGKIGDLKTHPTCKDGTIRLMVTFEEENQKPVLVRPENLRVVFDLPEE